MKKYLWMSSAAVAIGPIRVKRLEEVSCNNFRQALQYGVIFIWSLAQDGPIYTGRRGLKEAVQF